MNAIATAPQQETVSLSKLLKNARFLVFDLKNDNSWEIMSFKQVCTGLILHKHMSAGDELEAGMLLYRASEQALSIVFEDLQGNPDFAIQMF